MTRSPAVPLPPPNERRRLREACALTRAQLAKRLGVRPDTVRAWESGRSTPRGRNRVAYAELLSTLVTDTARQTPPVVDGVTIRTAQVEGGGGAAADPAEFALTPTALVSPPPADTSSGPGSSPERGSGSKGDPASGREAAPTDHSGPGREAEPGHASPPERKAVPVGGSDSVSARRGPSGGGALPAPGRADDGGGRRRPRPSWARMVRPSGRERASGVVPAARGAGPYLTPAQAFDALYAYCAPALVRQAYLLTGRRDLAHESVERAFQRAWDHWPEVARDPDPAGWVRAAAHDWALSPWHRLRRRYRHPEPPPPEEDDRALLDALLSLPPPYRRTLVLYDGVGLDLPETAAETEASTRATAGRLTHAREVLAERLPELADPGELHDRLAELASTGRTRAAEPAAVRGGSERRARLWTRTAAAVTVVLIGSTAMTLSTAPTHYVPPVPPGETVRGVPPRVAPGPLSDRQRELRDHLRKALLDGPERLSPQAR
ncbi:helix-turn-helix domain-containing protein [Streptomyces althioticus]|uniref:Helix-turn-helix domain-containing protein n=1 Tax=Streptomyces althioticus TaxID=83380 RepID=A0ABZ1Y3M8_9ACTN